jgi:hypothetical protein
MKLINKIETATGKAYLGKVKQEDLEQFIADARASHFQMTPATNVEVPHNLGKIPSVVFTYYSSGVPFACDWEPLASDPLNFIICKPAKAMMFKVYFN